MAIVNIRIDDRLIHGQVAAVWSLVTKANRIMVVDDLVVKDVVNKEALKMACPQQCKLSILTVEKAAGVKVTAQMVPTDEALDFVELIKKAEA